MLPKIILHNTISLNEALSGFPADLNLHYSIASGFKADGFIVGSSTILSANDEIPAEDESDFVKKDESESDTRPYWVVVDSKGILLSLLHYYRRMEYIRDIIVLVTDRTPDQYVEYLETRNYEFIRTEGDFVDYEKAFNILRLKYGIKILLSDSGATLNNVLLNRKLIDELSLIVSPILISDGPQRLFKELDLTEQSELELVELKKLEKDHIWIRYRIKK